MDFIVFCGIKWHAKCLKISYKNSEPGQKSGQNASPQSLVPQSIQGTKKTNSFSEPGQNSGQQIFKLKQDKGFRVFS